MNSKILAVLLALLCCAPALADYKSTVLGLAPYGYWRLDESSGTSFADSSGGGHTLTASNTGFIYGVTGLVNGDPDTALEWNGGPILTAAATNFSNESFDVLVNIATLGNPGGINVLVAASNFALVATNGTSGYKLGIGYNTAANGCTVTNLVGNSYTTSSFSYNQTHHLDAVWNKTGNTYAVYVDGTSVLSGTPGSLATSSNGVCVLGNGGANVVDEPIIFNKALTSTQVGNLYTAAHNPPSSKADEGFMGIWRRMQFLRLLDGEYW